MDQGHSDLNAFNVRWIEALSSQPYWHQNDDRLPGLVGGIRGCLAQWWVTQMHHIVFVHYSAKEHDGGKMQDFQLCTKFLKMSKTGRVDVCMHHLYNPGPHTQPDCGRQTFWLLLSWERWTEFSFFWRSNVPNAAMSKAKWEVHLKSNYYE